MCLYVSLPCCLLATTHSLLVAVSSNRNALQGSGAANNDNNAPAGNDDQPDTDPPARRRGVAGNLFDIHKDVISTLPEEARPDPEHPPSGSHSYQVWSKSGAIIEVNLKKKNFFITAYVGEEDSIP